MIFIFFWGKWSTYRCWSCVFKHVDTNTIVVAERGTEGSVSDILIDLQLFDAATNDQLNNAVDLTVNAVYQYPTSDLFVTGHSLGGFNAQFINSLAML